MAREPGGCRIFPFVFITFIFLSTLKSKKGESALVALGHDYEGLEGCTMSRFGGSLLNPDLDRVM